MARDILGGHQDRVDEEAESEVSFAVTDENNHFSTKQTFDQEIEVDGALNHDGSKVGFYGVAPVNRAAQYTQTFSTAARTHAAEDLPTEPELLLLEEVVSALATTNATVNELKRLVNALIDDSQAVGLSQ